MTKPIPLLSIFLFAFSLTACRTAADPKSLFIPGPMKYQGVKKVVVNVEITDIQTGYTVNAEDDDSDGNGDKKKHRLQQRAAYLEWRFAQAPVGGVVRFKFLNHPEYDFTCTLDGNRRCESNTFVMPCGSTGVNYTIKYDILFEHGGKSGIEDPWVVIEN